MRIDQRGAVVSHFAVGDAVEQMQADETGGIWVSYFDEASDALGAAGIAHFDLSGRQTWRLNDAGGSIPPVWDCYALNAVGDEAWACYYGEFPIVRVQRAGDLRVWTNEVDGAAAIAVDGAHVVLFGGYGEDASRIALLKLGRRAADWIGELRLTGPEVGRHRVVGRGDTIHVVDDETWRRFSVAEIKAAVEAAGEAAIPSTAD